MTKAVVRNVLCVLAGALVSASPFPETRPVNSAYSSGLGTAGAGGSGTECQYPYDMHCVDACVRVCMRACLRDCVPTYLVAQAPDKRGRPYAFLFLA